MTILSPPPTCAICRRRELGASPLYAPACDACHKDSPSPVEPGLKTLHVHMPWVYLRHDDTACSSTSFDITSILSKIPCPRRPTFHRCLSAFTQRVTSPFHFCVQPAPPFICVPNCIRLSPILPMDLLRSRWSIRTLGDSEGWPHHCVVRPGLQGRVECGVRNEHKGKPLHAGSHILCKCRLFCDEPTLRKVMNILIPFGIWYHIPITRSTEDYRMRTSSFLIQPTP